MMSGDDQVVVSLDSHVAMQRKRAAMQAHPLADEGVVLGLLAAWQARVGGALSAVAPAAKGTRRRGN